MESFFLSGIILTLASFLIGGIPFGVIFSKAFWKVDPRKGGSGGIGFTNVMRQVGKKAAFLTLVFDTIKGTFPVLLARHYTADVFWISGIALAAVLGHILSIYLKFKGGKGVATGFGVLVGISPAVAVFTVFVWSGVYFIWKYSSLGGLVSFGILPLSFFLFGEGEYLPFSLILMVLIYVKHIDNIKRLFQGTENRMSKKSNT